MTQQCILWTDGTNGRGYGRLGGTVNGKRQPLAHVAAWEAVYGPVPFGWQLHHICETPLCVSLCHLALVTGAMHNALHEQSRRRVVCSRGHPLTPANRVPNGQSPAGAQKWTCRVCKNQRRGR